MFLRDARRIGPLLTVLILGMLDWFAFSSHVRPADLLAFLGGAHSIARGVTPYVSSNAPALWAGNAFVYPWVTGWAFIPLAVLPVATAKIVFYLISLGALAAAWALLGGSTTRRGIALLVLTVAAEPVVRGLQLGTINALLLLGLALAWYFRDRAWVVVIALAAVIVAKLFLLPMVAWLLFTSRRKQAGWVLGISAAVILAGCWIGHTPVFSYAHMLSVLSAHESPHSSSIQAVLITAGLGAHLALVTAWLLAGAALAIGAGWARRRHDERFAFVGGVCAALLASPIVWSHYFTLLAVIPLLFRWRPSYAAAALVCTWLIAIPDAAQGLNAIHVFPGAGYVWSGLLAVAVLLVEYARARRNAAPRDRVGNLVHTS